MKRFAAIAIVLVLMLGALSACGTESGKPSPAPAETTPAETAPAESAAASVADNQVDLNGVYTVTDPEGVEYDTRVALYRPVLETEESYAAGCREMYTVLYGLDGKGVYMYNVEVYDTEADAEAYASEQSAGEVEGNIYVGTSDAAFFTAMESFVPDLNAWIDSQMASGMIEID